MPSKPRRFRMDIWVDMQEHVDPDALYDWLYGQLEDSPWAIRDKVVWEIGE